MKRFARILTASFLILLVGCPSVERPLEEYVLARSAIESAKNVQAARHSPGYWHQAEEAYRRARIYYTDRDWESAREEFIKARSAAEKAENSGAIDPSKNGRRPMNIARWGLLFAAFSTTACLKTRTDVREVDEQKVMSERVVSLQKENADAGSRFTDINEDIRELRGRVEVTENKLKAGGAENDRQGKVAMEQSQDANKKAAHLQEAIVRLESQVQGLNAEVQSLRAEVASSHAKQAAAPAEKKNTWDTGKDHFEQKDWKKAILALQDYREKNPKGKNAAEAAYLIGVSFQELGLKEEAKTFYEETIRQYPTSAESKKAKIRLKDLSSKKK